MKTFQVLAAILSTAAIAGGATFGSANSAEACLYSKLTGSQSGSTSTLSASGADKLNPWIRHKGTIGFGALAVILGLGAGYMSYRAGQEAKAACALLSDDFDVNELEEGVVEEVREHPEAPGGELDLATEIPVEEAIEAVADKTADKEVAIAK